MVRQPIQNAGLDEPAMKCEDGADRRDPEIEKGALSRPEAANMEFGPAPIRREGDGRLSK